MLATEDYGPHSIPVSIRAKTGQAGGKVTFNSVSSGDRLVARSQARYRRVWRARGAVQIRASAGFGMTEKRWITARDLLSRRNEKSAIWVSFELLQQRAQFRSFGRHLRPHESSRSTQVHTVTITVWIAACGLHAWACSTVCQS